MAQQGPMSWPFQGHAHGTYGWQLPADTPVRTMCGIFDLDWDGINDRVEAELAWAFRPYLLFDDGEETQDATGLVILYQARPVDRTGGGLKMKYKLVFLFRKDHGRLHGGGHNGDSETMGFEVSASGPSYQTWHLVKVHWRTSTWNLQDGWRCPGLPA